MQWIEWYKADRIKSRTQICYATHISMGLLTLVATMVLRSTLLIQQWYGLLSQWSWNLHRRCWIAAWTYIPRTLFRVSSMYYLQTTWNMQEQGKFIRQQLLPGYHQHPCYKVLWHGLLNLLTWNTWNQTITDLSAKPGIWDVVYILKPLPIVAATNGVWKTTNSAHWSKYWHSNVMSLVIMMLILTSPLPLVTISTRMGVTEH